MEARAAREILEKMDDKRIFTYIPDMEVSVPKTDRKSSLDKIATYYNNEQFTISDLFIGYAVSLFRFTIPKVIASTIEALGSYWPEKYVPRNITREDLLSRIKKMCSMGMLRRYVYQVDENNIVLYSTTPEFARVVYQTLKLSTDARPEKNMIAPIEVVERAATSLVTSELLKSKYLSEFDFMPDFKDSEGKLIFNSKIIHTVGDKKFATICEPVFSAVDTKRFTKAEWNTVLNRKIKGVLLYMDELENRGYIARVIFVCENFEDFRKISTIICNTALDKLEKIYYTAEGSLKSGNYDLKNSLVKVITVSKNSDKDGEYNVPERVTSKIDIEYL